MRESDECASLPAAEQNGGSLGSREVNDAEVVRRKDEVCVDEKVEVIRAAVKQIEEAGTAREELSIDREQPDIEKDVLNVCSEAVEQRDEAGMSNGMSLERRKQEYELINVNDDDAEKKKSTGRGKRGVERNIKMSRSVPSCAVTTEKSNDGKELKINRRVSLRSDAIKLREEADSNKKKTSDKMNAQILGSAVTMQRQDADTDVKKASERRKDELLDFSEKRTVVLDAVEPREEVHSSKSSAAGTRSKKDHRNDKRSSVRSAVEEARICMKVSEGRSSELVLKAGKKRAIGSDASKQREQADSGKKKKTATGRGCMELVKCDMGLKYVHKKVAEQDEIKQGEEAGNNKKKGIGIGIYEELEIDKKRDMETWIVEGNEEVSIEEKEVTALGPENETYRKRDREGSDTEISLKRIKTGLKHGQDQTKEIDAKKMKAGFLRHRDQRTEAEEETDRIFGPEVPDGRQSDGISEKTSPVNLSNAVKSGTEKVRFIERSGHRTLRKLKDNTASSVGAKIQKSDISQQKSCRAHGKDGVMARLPSNKNVDELEEVHIQKEDEEKVRATTSTMPSSISNLCTTPNHPSLSGGKIVLAKPGSILLEKNNFCEIKREPKTSSPVPKNVGMSTRKNVTDNKMENISIAETPLLAKQIKSSGSCSTVRQRIREHIKGILLSAGWKIDLRPRRGRECYKDQIYIPPKGGTGYWSITKAYDVFQKQSNPAHDSMSDKISRKPSRKSSRKSSGKYNNVDGSSSLSSAIPVELLSMLRKNIVNRRTGKIEIEEAQDDRSKKPKETTKMKDSKSEVIKNFSGKNRGRRKLNTVLDSGSKGLSGKSNIKQRGRSLLARGANRELENENDDYLPYIWNRTVLSWMIDFGTVPVNGKVIYKGNKQKHSMLEGRVTRDGICCSCCSKIITVSKFEIHAGSKLHQPYQNIYLEGSRISLLQCLLDTWEKQHASERQGFYTLDVHGDDPNDDACGICGDGGDLMCCDGCPSTFHQSCLDIEMLPSGDWHCSNCSCRFCGVISEVSDVESDAPASPLMHCYQCEKKYHLECVPEDDAIVSSSDSFCGRTCRKLFKRLQKLVGLKTDLEAGFSFRVTRRLVEDSPLTSFELPQRAESNAKIAVALGVMDECFLPIIDPRSGINLIHNVVYNCGSNFSRLNYNGFYTFILERGDEIISAASIRLHGTRLAEMPFIGTRNMYRRQGMCRRLLNGIEAALSSLGIHKLIIPAISELVDTWTTVFGFKPLKTSHKREIKSVNMLVFPGIGLLQKSLLKGGLSGKADNIGTRIKRHEVSEVAADSFDPSCFVTNLFLSKNATADANNGLKNEENSHPDLHCYMRSGSHVALEFEFQNTDHKSVECVADTNLSVHPRASYQHEAIEKDVFQVNALSAPKTNLFCKSNVCHNNDVNIGEAEIVSNSHTTENTSEHFSKVKCISADATGYTLQNAGIMASSKLPSAEDTSLLQNPEAYTACTLQDSDGKDLRTSASSQKYVLVATHINRSDVTNTSSLLCSVETHLQASGACIVDYNVEFEDQIPPVQHKRKTTCALPEASNSEVPTGTMDSIKNKCSATSTEYSIHTICNGTVNPNEEVAQVVDVKLKSDANDRDAKPYAFEHISESCAVPLGEGSQVSSRNSVAHVSDSNTIPISATSGDTVEVCDKWKPT